MIKTTRIHADLLAAMQDVVTDKHDMNAVLRGSIPTNLELSSRRLDAWARDWGYEVNEQLERSDYCEEINSNWDLFRWGAATLGGEVSSLMGWDREVQVVDMIQAGTGWNNLYLFTQPVSNTIAQVLAVWADDETDAVEALEDWAKEQGEEEGCFSDEIELDIEMWLSSPAYCVEAA